MNWNFGFITNDPTINILGYKDDYSIVIFEITGNEYPEGLKIERKICNCISQWHDWNVRYFVFDQSPKFLDFKLYTEQQIKELEEWFDFKLT